MPTIHGMELEDGHDLGLDDIPQCCNDDMTSADQSDGSREYACGSCGSKLIVKANGLVLDIYEAA